MDHVNEWDRKAQLHGRRTTVQRDLAVGAVVTLRMLEPTDDDTPPEAA